MIAAIKNSGVAINFEGPGTANQIQAAAKNNPAFR
jgi:hypothetical protein